MASPAPAATPRLSSPPALRRRCCCCWCLPALQCKSGNNVLILLRPYFYCHCALLYLVGNGTKPYPSPQPTPLHSLPLFPLVRGSAINHLDKCMRISFHMCEQKERDREGGMYSWKMRREGGEGKEEGVHALTVISVSC